MDISFLPLPNFTRSGNTRSVPRWRDVTASIFFFSSWVLLSAFEISSLSMCNVNENLPSLSSLAGILINESGTFRSGEALADLSDEDRKAQDDELFARARLVNCGWFMRVILGDYVGAILGLVRDGLGWRLDPLAVRNSTFITVDSELHQFVGIARGRPYCEPSW